jgi:hypothetical protein
MTSTRMWVVVDSDGDILSFTTSRTRRKAIAEWLALWAKPSYAKWRKWYRRGYRCRRATLTVETPP